MRAFTKFLCYLLLFHAILLSGCGAGNSTKTIKLEDIRPKSKENLNNFSKSIQKDTLLSFYKYYANDSAQLSIATISIDSNTTNHFLDRFSHKTRKLLLSDSTNHTFQYHSWSFEDSSTCFEAFFNWLDQAGPKQQSVSIGKGNISHTGYGVYIVAHHEILFLNSAQAIAAQKWLKWFEGKTDAGPIHYVLRLQPKQKTKWFQYQNAKLRPL